MEIINLSFEQQRVHGMPGGLYSQCHDFIHGRIQKLDIEDHTTKLRTQRSVFFKCHGQAPCDAGQLSIVREDKRRNILERRSLSRR